QVSLVRRMAQRRGWGEYFSYSRDIYILLLFTLGKGFQISIGSVSINLYAHSLGFDAGFIGLLTAAPAIGALVASVPIGLLADRIGRKPLLLVSGFLNPLSLAAVGLSTDKTFLLAASLANGFLSSAYWVTNLPMLTEGTSDDQRVGVMALNNFLLLGIGSLGALLGGLVPELVGRIAHMPADATVPLRYGVVASAVVTFLPAVPLLWLHEPDRLKAEQREERRGAVPPAVPGNIEPAAAPMVATQVAETTKVAEVAEPVGRWGAVKLFTQLLVPDMLFSTGEGAVVGLLQLFFFLKFGTDVGEVGVIFAVAGLIGGMTALTAPRFVRRFGQLSIATTMQYLSAPIMLIIGFSPLLPLAIAAEFARRILRGLFDPTYATFAMERVSSRHRATLSGFYSVTWSIGFSIGPAIAGFLWKNISFSSAFVVGAAMLAVSATLLRAFFGKGAPILR
ncbi:MAG TPA: MFS transporter, partial [Ktedonobacterales bacterium]|nr:MFS transporter [Ktedonobacterales bacterium]